MKKAIKVLFIVLGSLSLGLGILGIFLPLLPTTPFLLLTAICYSKGSDRLHKKLLNSSLGHYIVNYRKNKTIPARIKVMALIMLWISVGSTVIFLKGMLVLKIFMFLSALVISYHIGRLKTPKKFEY